MTDLLAEFNRIAERLQRMEQIVAVHPDDLTDELRKAIEASPMTTLRESRHVPPGKVYVINPGLLEDLQ